MLKPFWGTLLSFLFFLSSSVFSYSSEANFWKARATKREGPIHPVHSTLTSIVNRSGPGSKKDIPSGLEDALVQLSSNEGQIKEVFVAPNAGEIHPPILLIQDVHLNEEAQKNISLMIQKISTHWNVKKKSDSILVGVEGAFGDFDFSRFRAFPNKEISQSVHDHLLAENRISAPTHAALSHKSQPPVYVGLDSLLHYTDNQAAYMKSKKKLKKNVSRLNNFKRKLRKEKEKELQGDLYRLDILLDREHENTIPFGKYVEGLYALYQKILDYEFSSQQKFQEIALFLEAYRLEKELDFSLVQEQRSKWVKSLANTLSDKEMKNIMEWSLARSSGRLTPAQFYKLVQNLSVNTPADLQNYPELSKYTHYAGLNEEIDGQALFRSIRIMAEDIERALIGSEKENQIMNQAHEVRLIEKLIEFRLIPEEWDDYRNTFSNEKSRSLVRNELELGPFENFYYQADFRSDAFVENLEERLLLDKKFGLAVFVLGGFHTPMVTSALKEKGFSYAVIQPKISKFENEEGEHYLSFFAQEKTPLDQVLEGKKLFLAPSLSQFGAIGPRSPNSKALASERLGLITNAALHADAGEIVPKETGVTVSERDNGWEITLQGSTEEENVAETWTVDMDPPESTPEPVVSVDGKNSFSLSMSRSRSRSLFSIAATVVFLLVMVGDPTSLLAQGIVDSTGAAGVVATETQTWAQYFYGIFVNWKFFWIMVSILAVFGKSLLRRFQIFLKSKDRAWWADRSFMKFYSAFFGADWIRDSIELRESTPWQQMKDRFAPVRPVFDFFYGAVTKPLTIGGISAKSVIKKCWVGALRFYNGVYLSKPLNPVEAHFRFMRLIRNQKTPEEKQYWAYYYFRIYPGGFYWATEAMNSIRRAEDAPSVIVGVTSEDDPSASSYMGYDESIMQILTVYLQSMVELRGSIDGREEREIFEFLKNQLETTRDPWVFRSLRKGMINIMPFMEKSKYGRKSIGDIRQALLVRLNQPTHDLAGEDLEDRVNIQSEAAIGIGEIYKEYENIQILIEDLLPRLSDFDDWVQSYLLEALVVRLQREGYERSLDPKLFDDMVLELISLVHKKGQFGLVRLNAVRALAYLNPADLTETESLSLTRTNGDSAVTLPEAAYVINALDLYSEEKIRHEDAHNENNQTTAFDSTRALLVQSVLYDPSPTMRIQSLWALERLTVGRTDLQADYFLKILVEVATNKGHLSFQKGDISPSHFKEALQANAERIANCNCFPASFTQPNENIDALTPEEILSGSNELLTNPNLYNQLLPQFPELAEVRLPHQSGVASNEDVLVLNKSVLRHLWPEATRGVRNNPLLRNYALDRLRRFKRSTENSDLRATIDGVLRGQPDLARGMAEFGSRKGLRRFFQTRRLPYPDRTHHNIVGVDLPRNVLKNPTILGAYYVEGANIVPLPYYMQNRDQAEVDDANHIGREFENAFFLDTASRLSAGIPSRVRRQDPYRLQSPKGAEAILTTVPGRPIALLGNERYMEFASRAVSVDARLIDNRRYVKAIPYILGTPFLDNTGDAPVLKHEELAQAEKSLNNFIDSTAETMRTQHNEVPRGLFTVTLPPLPENDLPAFVVGSQKVEYASSDRTQMANQLKKLVLQIARDQRIDPHLLNRSLEPNITVEHRQGHYHIKVELDKTQSAYLFTDFLELPSNIENAEAESESKEDLKKALKNLYLYDEETEIKDEELFFLVSRFMDDYKVNSRSWKRLRTNLETLSKSELEDHLGAGLDTITKVGDSVNVTVPLSTEWVTQRDRKRFRHLLSEVVGTENFVRYGPYENGEYQVQVEKKNPLKPTAADFQAFNASVTAPLLLPVVGFEEGGMVIALAYFAFLIFYNWYDSQARGPIPRALRDSITEEGLDRDRFATELEKLFPMPNLGLENHVENTVPTAARRVINQIRTDENPTIEDMARASAILEMLRRNKKAKISLKEQVLNSPSPLGDKRVRVHIAAANQTPQELLASANDRLENPSRVDFFVVNEKVEIESLNDRFNSRGVFFIRNTPDFTPTLNSLSQAIPDAYVEFQEMITINNQIDIFLAQDAPRFSAIAHSLMRLKDFSPSINMYLLLLDRATAVPLTSLDLDRLLRFENKMENIFASQA